MFLSDPVLCFYVHAGCGLLWQTTVPLRRYSEPSKTFPMRVDPGGLAWHSSFWSTLFSAPSSGGILPRRYAALHSEVDCYTLKKKNLNLGNFWQHAVSQALGEIIDLRLLPMLQKHACTVCFGPVWKEMTSQESIFPLHRTCGKNK